MPISIHESPRTPAPLTEETCRYLCFDLGTGRLKVSLFDASGACLGTIARRNREFTAGSERWQSPDDWWQHCIEATDELIQSSGVAPSTINALSLAGRAGAGVFVGPDGDVLCPAWSDSRHVEYLSRFRLTNNETGNAGYGPAILAKLLWLREHTPGVAKRVAHALYAKDFLLYRMTGRAMTDPSSGPDGPWPASLLEQAAVHADLLPEVKLPWSIAGPLTNDAARALGLTPGTPVVVGAHDGVAANIGAGAIADGGRVLTLGTHAVVRAISRHTVPDATRFYQFPPDLHVYGANALNAGRCVDWAADMFFSAGHASDSAFVSMETALAGRLPDAHCPVFLPWPGGQLAPQRRPGARASFHNIDLATDRTALGAAVLQGVTFAIASVADSVNGWLGEVPRMPVTGSAIENETWLQFIASVLNTTLDVSDNRVEGRGAAICAAVAIGAQPDLNRAVAAMVRHTLCFTPDPGLVSPDSPMQVAREKWRHTSDADVTRN